MSLSNLSNLIKPILDQATQKKLFPAGVVGVVTKNGDRIVIPAGKYTFEDDSLDVKEDSIFDMASITKVLPTASLTFQAIDEGKIGLYDKVIDIIPELNNQHTNEITIQHLLNHTLNFGIRLSQFRDKKPKEILDVIFNSKLTSPPGKSRFYSGATSILLGIVAERIYGERLDHLLEDRFADPLSMTRTLFYPLTHFPKNDIVPSQNDISWRKRVIQGEVHDGASFALGREICGGAAGLFSTAPDILKFLEMIINHGTLHGKTYFSDKSIGLMQEGYTWDVSNKNQIGDLPSRLTISKTGFTGAIIIADIERGIGISILTNYIFSQETNDTTLDVAKNIDRFKLLNDFRIKIVDLVYKNL